MTDEAIKTEVAGLVERRNELEAELRTVRNRINNMKQRLRKRSQRTGDECGR